MFESFVAAGRADEEFVAKLLIANRGVTATISSEEDDIHNHVDFWWTPQNSTQGLELT